VEAGAARPRLLVGLPCHTSTHTGTRRVIYSGSPEKSVQGLSKHFSITSHPVWGYVPLTGIAATVLVRESCGIRGTVDHPTSTRLAAAGTSPAWTTGPLRSIGVPAPGGV
jgi:hypothetical protein